MGCEQSCEQKTDIVAAYYGSWMPINTIDPTLLDVAYFSFLDVDSEGKILYEDHDSKIKSFIKLKEQNNNIKLIAAIGGWSAGTTNFSKMANNSSARSKFAINALNLTQKYSFDGIDIDWEFPVIGGETANGKGVKSVNDKESLVLLLEELRNQLKPHRKCLTVAVSADTNRSLEAYNIVGLANNVDMINIMTYDYGSKRGDHNAPYDKVLASVNHFINHGCPTNKLVLGLPAYGYEYQDSCEKEGISFQNILQKYDLNASQWNNSQKVPYLNLQNSWITYDDETSIKEKVKIVKERGLKGCFFWSSHQDDYDGEGGKGKFPLIRAARESLK